MDYKAHDHFFRKVMSDNRVAKEFFDAHLPEDLRAVIILNQLELQPGTFIKEEFSKEIGDNIMTVAEQLKAEGVKEGVKEERMMIAKRLISEEIDEVFIAKITELSLEQIKSIKAKVH